MKDSKLLTPKKRLELAKSIKNIVKRFKLIIIPPKLIDSEINSSNSNLNLLEVKKSAEIIEPNVKKNNPMESKITGANVFLRPLERLIRIRLYCTNNNVETIKQIMKPKMTIISLIKRKTIRIKIQPNRILVKIPLFFFNS